MFVIPSPSNVDEIQPLDWAERSSAQPESPKYKGSGLSAGLSKMFQFPAGMLLIKKKKMIYDNLSNIDLYKGLSTDLYTGLLFLQQAKPDVENGTYLLNSRVKVIVSEYETKKVNEYGYEAHKRFIDIQCVLKGEKKVNYLPIKRLTETKPYDSEIEAAFYKAEEKPQEMIIGNNYFAIFFPQDGHMPQLCIDEPKIVKKVVVKVAIA